MRMGKKTPHLGYEEIHANDGHFDVHVFCEPTGVASPISSTPESPAPARMYHLLREDDDWSFLADPAMRKDFWDPIKYIRLRSGRNDWLLSIGGEAREVWEQIGNDNWGQQPFMNAYFQPTVHGLFRRSLRQARSVVRRVKKRFEFSIASVDRGRSTKRSSISKQHFSNSERGMNATGSRSESGDRRWSMAPGG